MISYHIKIERWCPVQENKGGRRNIIIMLSTNRIICSLKLWKNNISRDRYNDY